MVVLQLAVGPGKWPFTKRVIINVEVRLSMTNGSCPRPIVFTGKSLLDFSSLVWYNKFTMSESFAVDKTKRTS